MGVTKLGLFFLFFTFLFLSCHNFLTSCNADEGGEVEDEHEFTYVRGTAKGPEHWAQLNPHWGVCGNGKLQSPIDIRHHRVKVLPNLGKLKKKHKAAPAVVKNRGHDITMEWKGDAGSLDINGTEYKLKQCHWHTPSEHTINGTRYAMELHMVHKTDQGQIAVIGILYKHGRPDTFLAKTLPHVNASGEEGKDVGIVNPRDIKFGSRKYYRYIGSLTIPPCTEGVAWTVVKKVRTVSREQVKVLRDAVHDGFEANARPTQNLDGRPVFLYTPKVLFSS